jgi:hypothetical protein
MFAPATTQTWRDFIKMLVLERNETLLRAAQILRPKEFEMMSPELEKIMEQLEAEEPEQYANDWFEAIKMRWARAKPAEKVQLLANLTPEERLAGLTPEQKSQALAGLTPEEKLEWFKTLRKELGQD